MNFGKGILIVVVSSYANAPVTIIGTKGVIATVGVTIIDTDLMGMYYNTAVYTVSRLSLKHDFALEQFY